MCFKTRCGSIGISHFVLHKCKIKVIRKIHISKKRGKNVGSFCKKWEKSKDAFIIYNRATSRFEAHLVYKHTQNPDFLISNAR